MKKFKKILLWILGILLVIIFAGISYLHFSAYQPSTQANHAARTAIINPQVTTFKAKHNKMTVIFYPGALVKPNSYSIWAKGLAKQGYTVKIAHFPLNMAFFKINAANKLISNNEPYVIGEHSLGGAIAARYAHYNYNHNLKGVFFLGAYADEKGRLDKLKLPVLSITASHDGVLNWQKYQTDKKYLPQDTQYVTTKGGNHGGFGSYGTQKGDKKATISNLKQQEIIVRTITKWLKKIN